MTIQTPATAKIAKWPQVWVRFFHKILTLGLDPGLKEKRRILSESTLALRIHDHLCNQPVLFWEVFCLTTIVFFSSLGKTFLMKMFCFSTLNSGKIISLAAVFWMEFALILIVTGWEENMMKEGKESMKSILWVEWYC